MPVADFTVKQGETEPIFAQQILDSTGSPVNLTGATGQLTLRSLTSATPLTLTGTVTIWDPTNGKIQWQPSAQDTATAGMYMGAWRITYANGTVQSYPTDGYVYVLIEQSLSSADQQLVSLPELKDYLNIGITDRSHDAKLLGFINDITPLVENVVGPVIVRTIDEWHEGGQYWIRLRRRPSFALGMNPLLQILSCDEYRGPTRYTLSVVPEPTSASIYSVMLDQRTGTLYRRTTGGGVIPFGAGPFGGAMPQAVHVVYQCGQSPVPGNIRRAALEAIRWLHESTMPTGMNSRALADQLDVGSGPRPYGLPPSAMQWLSPAKRHPATA